MRDARFGSTPLGRARHFGHDSMAELLQAVTAPDAPDAPDADGG